MKKLYFLLSVCLLASVLNAQVSKTVTATAGNLRTAFTTTERTTVTNLTVTGTIDARDFKFMRDTLSALSVVDLSAVTIAGYTGTAGTYSMYSSVYLANGIPQYAFSNNASLKTIILPNSITSVGTSAFYDCQNLTGNLTIPNSVTTIGNNAFFLCQRINGTLTIGSGVTSIGDEAFYDCSGIKIINSLNTTPATPGYSSFYSIYPSVVYVPASAVTAYKAATGWSSLPISGPGIAVSVSSITGLNYAPGATAPYQSSFTLSGGLLTDNVVLTAPINFDISTTSGTAFVPASSITLSHAGGILTLDTIYVRLKTGLALNTYTGNISVSSTGVTSQTIALAGTVRPLPETINVSTAGTLGSFFATSERANITKLTVTGTIDARDFKFMRDTLSALSILDLSGVTVASYTGTAGTYSYSNTYPANGIPQYAFFNQSTYNGKTSLKTIILPASITSIGSQAFYYCSGLTGELTIPSLVTTIGSDAFYDCNFSIINSLNTTPPTLATNFYNISLVYVPASSIAAYKAASIWSSYLIITEKKVTINNPTAGGLANALITEGYGPLSSITQLTVTGSLNSDDISQINTNMTVLGELDLSGATLAGNTLPASAFQNNSYLSSVKLPATLLTIGAEAFYYCRSLASITIPNSVTSIGASAFYNCTGLTFIDIPNSVVSIGTAAFFYCTDLTSITIPNSVTSIEDMEFYGCSDLVSITIPNSVTSIGAQAFYGTAWYSNQPAGLVYVGKIAYAYKGTMPANTTIILNDGTLGISGNAFSSCTGLTSITIPNTVTSIGDGAFYGCTGLSSITIPASVLLVGSRYSKIGYYYYYNNGGVFQNCTGLGSVTLGQGVTIIGNSAFLGCSGLSKITFPATVDSIGNSAFEGCSGLTTVAIPASIKYIGSYAFENCTGLTSATTPFAYGYSYNGSSYNQYPIFDSNNANLTTFTIPEGVKSIQSGAFSGFTKITSVILASTVDSIGANAFNGCSGLNSITIPNGVLSIGNGAFQDCTGLTSITIPSSVHLIGSAGNSNYAGSGVFYNCTGLSSVTIGENVTCIGNSAFYGCTSLPSITIPASVITIGNSAFQGCTGLSSIAIPSKVTSIGSDAFQSCTGLKSLMLSADTIGSGAFSECSDLSSVTLSEGVKKIGSNAFEDCGKITTLSFPSTLTNLGSQVLYNCYGLSDIASLRVNPAQCFSNTFDGMNTNTCKLRVPAGSGSYYKYDTGWSDFYLNTVEDVSINSPVQSAKAFTAVVQNGQVVVKGDIGGELVSLYNAHGNILYQQQANAASVTMNLPAIGVYIVRVGSQTVKVAY